MQRGNFFGVKRGGLPSPGLAGWGWVLLAALWLVSLPAAVAAPAKNQKAVEPAALETDAVVPPAEIEVFNRKIATLRAPIFGELPKSRARLAEIRIQEILNTAGEHEVLLQEMAQGQMVLMDGQRVFTISPGDVDPATNQSAAEAAATAADKLRTVIAETAEIRSVSALLKDFGLVLLGAAVFYGLQRGASWLRRYLLGWLMRLSQTNAERANTAGILIFRMEGVLTLARGLISGLFWLISLMLVYVWLGYTLSRLPYTRHWGEAINQFTLGVLEKIAASTLHALPNLFIAVLILLLARLVVRVLQGFFEMVQRRQIELHWLDADLATPTRRIATVIIWLFALAMAYPYLPVAQTEAFKGVTLLFGLMVSLGASGLVGQAVSGMILTYTRVFRPGEFVQIAGNEGTVMETGVFATRIRTGMGDELTLPNTYILSNVTRNYSRAVQGGQGFIVDATVTIGYDTPWRQVHAMLIEAARRTPGILEDPLPRVYQIALSDFYPEYRLVCQAIPNEPRPRAEVMSLLHANIQDVFNEYGVQIMSPHYMTDPVAAKVVPMPQWYAAPAVPPADSVKPG